MAQINVNEEGLELLRSTLIERGESYKTSLNKLTNVINEITNGNIKGDLATELSNKFQEKKEDFINIAKTIDDAEQYMGLQYTKFENNLSNIGSDMR